MQDCVDLKGNVLLGAPIWMPSNHLVSQHRSGLLARFGPRDLCLRSRAILSDFDEGVVVVRGHSVGRNAIDIAITGPVPRPTPSASPSLDPDLMVTRAPNARYDGVNPP